ncbi:putative secreted protease [Janibacter sp. HTCC2649]|uniref:immune inhibitor A domain-containing protein n=1 Tax=Janibacter sp. HTCC2649 TaxID=313589 RepID=UPI0000671952|nr:immune inhibitor A domain-containing protein [Janibacter sp. HTCC2649]EAP97987.1 putative secreted protease [Janibacter sp. HTCC2649]
MTARRSTRARWRYLAIAPAVALAATGLTLGSGSVAAAPKTGPVGSGVDAAVGAGYINYVAPRMESAFSTDKAAKIKGKAVSKTSAKTQQDALAKAKVVDRKHSQGNPVAARQLAKIEAKAIKTGQSPKALKAETARKYSRYKSAPTMQQAKLLTILVEFNENANDDFSGAMVPDGFGAEGCVAGNVQNGPTHNQIPNPATSDLKDNNSMWLSDFSSEHYNKMLYTKSGITERVRTDLTGPDGKPGIDISGYTMKNMYEEMSKGAYTVGGAATPWITVPHSEAYYGATVCHKDENGKWVYGAMQDMQGHPSNAKGPGQLPIDAVASLAKAQPNFPWADYDLEDQGDVDGDGNVLEPDGVIDHVVLVHAGEDKSGGGGAEGPYAIWAHSSAVAGGAPVPGTNLRLSNYIVQPEDSGVGVFAHEYGHDLGLPDLYDTASGGDSDVDFWDLMSSGSHSGPIFQSMPTHMGIWDKWVLGWADPLQMNPGDAAKSIKVGQTSRTPKGSADGVKINLPNKVVTRATPHSGTKMWWGSNDQNWAMNSLTRSVTVPANADAKFWMWNNYVIEKDWDFGFVEVSTDGGTTWTPQKVYNEAGAEVSTPDAYADPNGNLATFGNRKYGLTGTSDGWRHDYINLGAWAGQSVKVRLMQSTDAAFTERGWFADDFSVTGGGATTFSDNVEGGANGWTATTGTWVGGEALGAGWIIDSGTSSAAQYYLVEWRNFDGFDKGLQYAYDTTYQKLGGEGAWKVEKIKYNAPGALVWYRDTSYGDANHVLNNLTTLPSEGAKGGLLIVDSHFDPLRRTGANAALDPSTLKNLPSRPQSSNAAFNVFGSYPFKECSTKADFTGEACNTFGAQSAVKSFTDNKGWYPGFEIRGEDIFYRDADASTVVPSVGNAPYSVRVVDAAGNPLPQYYGVNIGAVTPLGTGNPSDAGVGYGTGVTVTKAFVGNQSALLQITPPKAK